MSCYGRRRAVQNHGYEKLSFMEERRCNASLGRHFRHPSHLLTLEILKTWFVPLFILLYVWTGASTVGVVARLGAESLRNRISILGRVHWFSGSSYRPECFRGTHSSFSGSKMVRRDAAHSPTSSVEIGINAANTTLLIMCRYKHTTGQFLLYFTFLQNNSPVNQ